MPKSRRPTRRSMRRSRRSAAPSTRYSRRSIVTSSRSRVKRMLDEGRRLQVLAAMGVDVYQLRGVRDAASDTAPVLAPGVGESVVGVAVAIVAVCAHGARADLRLARLFAQLPRSLGIGAARLAW